MQLFKFIVKEQLNASKIEYNVNHEDTATTEEMKTVNFAPTVEGVNVSSLDSPQWDQSKNKSTKEDIPETKRRK